MSDEAAPAAPVYKCRWAYHNSDKQDNPETCSLQFSSKDALREHVLSQHVNAEPAIPISCMQVWKSESGLWRGKVKPDALSKFVESLKSDGGTSHEPMDTDNNTFPEKTSDVPKTPFTVPPYPSTQINSLEAQGITRSQEAAVVTQVFSPYITSSDEHPQTNSNTTAAAAHQTPSSDRSQSPSQTHIRNASGDSASLPQSNDYQTVPGILPREIPPPRTAAAAPSLASPVGQTSVPPLPLGHASPTINNSSFSVKATTPLHVGIAFGSLPSVSSSSGSGTSAASSNPLNTGPHDHNESTTATGGAGARSDSPNSSRKHMDRTLRFGFGRK